MRRIPAGIFAKFRSGVKAGITPITTDPGLAFGGAGTATATLAGTNIAGFPNPMVVGVSEIEFDLTCVCSSGHSKNETLVMKCK